MIANTTHSEFPGIDNGATLFGSAHVFAVYCIFGELFSGTVSIEFRVSAKDWNDLADWNVE
jgi:hypothetical protein